MKATHPQGGHVQLYSVRSVGCFPSLSHPRAWSCSAEAEKEPAEAGWTPRILTAPRDSRRGACPPHGPFLDSPALLLLLSALRQRNPAWGGGRGEMGVGTCPGERVSLPNEGCAPSLVGGAQPLAVRLLYQENAQTQRMGRGAALALPSPHDVGVKWVSSHGTIGGHLAVSH